MAQPPLDKVPGTRLLDETFRDDKTYSRWRAIRHQNLMHHQVGTHRAFTFTHRPLEIFTPAQTIVPG